MHKQAKMRVRAARAAQNPTIGREPGTALPAHLRMIQPAGRPSMRIRQTKARMTAAQRDSAGRYSDWNKAAHFWTDAAWDRTVTS